MFVHVAAIVVSIDVAVVAIAIVLLLLLLVLLLLLLLLLLLQSVICGAGDVAEKYLLLLWFLLILNGDCVVDVTKVICVDLICAAHFICMIWSRR